MIWLEALGGCMAWAALWRTVELVSDRRRRQDLTERLARFQPTVADEAHAWLSSQR